MATYIFFALILVFPITARGLITLTVSSDGCTRDRVNYPTACAVRTDECVRPTSSVWNTNSSVGIPPGSFTNFSAADDTRLSFMHCWSEDCSPPCYEHTTEEMANWLNMSSAYMLYDYTKRCVELAPRITLYVATCGTEALCDTQSCQVQDCLEDFCIGSYRNGTCLANAQCTGALHVDTTSESEQSDSMAPWERSMRLVNYILIAIGCCGIVVGGCALWVLEMRDQEKKARVEEKDPDENGEQTQEEA